MSVFDVLEAKDDQAPLSLACLVCRVAKASKAYVVILALVEERKIPVELATLIDTMRTEQPSNLVTLDTHERRGICADTIPQELLVYRQWVCWRYVDRGEGRKPDKQPVNPRTLANAGVHWANTWTGFDEAYATYLRHCNEKVHGIGFVLTPGDPYVAVDLDSCVCDDEIDTDAAQIVAALDSYSEISPSGHGLRILIACPAFQNNTRREATEIYSHSRYVTVTGHHVPVTPLTISPVLPEVIAALLLPVPEHNPSLHTNPHQRPETSSMDDMGLWERIFARDKYGDQHLRRFQGDSSLDRGDHSLTIIRLLNHLARWTHCDSGRMRSMILLSPLVNDKWIEKRGGGDWLDHQIADAVAYIGGSKAK